MCKFLCSPFGLRQIERDTPRTRYFLLGVFFQGASAFSMLGEHLENCLPQESICTRSSVEGICLACEIRW